jgi:hypothetical protein
MTPSAILDVEAVTAMHQPLRRLAAWPQGQWLRSTGLTVRET